MSPASAKVGLTLNYTDRVSNLEEKVDVEIEKGGEADSRAANPSSKTVFSVLDWEASEGETLLTLLLVTEAVWVEVLNLV